MKKLIDILPNFFLFIFLISLSTLSFAYVEKVRLLKAHDDEKIIIKRKNHDVYLLTLGLGCRDIVNYVGRRIALTSSGSNPPAFGLTDASTHVVLRNGQNCIIWDATLI